MRCIVLFNRSHGDWMTDLIGQQQMFTMRRTLIGLNDDLLERIVTLPNKSDNDSVVTHMAAVRAQTHGQTKESNHNNNNNNHNSNNNDSTNSNINMNLMRAFLFRPRERRKKERATAVLAQSLTLLRDNPSIPDDSMGRDSESVYSPLLHSSSNPLDFGLGLIWSAESARASDRRLSWAVPHSSPTDLMSNHPRPIGALLDRNNLNNGSTSIPNNSHNNSNNINSRSSRYPYSRFSVIRYTNISPFFETIFSPTYSSNSPRKGNANEVSQNISDLQRSHQIQTTSEIPAGVDAGMSSSSAAQPSASRTGNMAVPPRLSSNSTAAILRATASANTTPISASGTEPLKKPENQIDVGSSINNNKPSEANSNTATTIATTISSNVPKLHLHLHDQRNVAAVTVNTAALSNIASPSRLSPSSSSIPISPSSAATIAAAISTTLFSKQSTPLRQSYAPKRSALSLLLNDQGATENPFADDFGFLSGKGEAYPIRIKIFIPSSPTPAEPLLIIIKRDATVEELIGYTLYEYFNRLSNTEVDPTEFLPSEKCDVCCWNLRLVEDDGTIDEDFPALDRVSKMQRSNFDALAMCLCTPAQIATNITARKSRPAIRPKPSLSSNQVNIPGITSKMSNAPLPPLPPGATTGPNMIANAAFGTTSTSNSNATTTSSGQNVSIGVTVAPSGLTIAPSQTTTVGPITTASAIATSATVAAINSTAINSNGAPATGHIPPTFQNTSSPQAPPFATTATLMAPWQQQQQQLAIPAAAIAAGGPAQKAQVYVKIHLYSTLEVKHTATFAFSRNVTMGEVFETICTRRKYDSEHYVLKMGDTKTDVALDRILGDMHALEFCVLKKDRGGAGDIFLRPPDEVKAVAERDVFDFSNEEIVSIYRQYNVTQKQLINKNERIITLDGEYIHIMSVGEKSLVDTGKTVTYHIGSINSCTLVKKQARQFKLSVARAGVTVGSNSSNNAAIAGGGGGGTTAGGGGGVNGVGGGINGVTGGGTTSSGVVGNGIVGSTVSASIVGGGTVAGVVAGVGTGVAGVVGVSGATAVAFEFEAGSEMQAADLCARVSMMIQLYSNNNGNGGIEQTSSSLGIGIGGSMNGRGLV
ncbi:hypothetical protein HK100_004407 [Physocladia obscura]|uniref:Sin1 middle CRIM domain-containing protein n=1 Tax=Physocladia obscura TaxID=109957 RepID=A0AAD5T8T8_9FUNG|nr:hypothetical protein HK100_004407 [Physocladia obscura]